MKARSQSLLIRTKRSKASGQMARDEMKWTAARAVRELKRLGEKRNVEGMARYGIRAKKVFGVSKPKLDELAKRIGKNHELGMELWETGIHDARILGVLISEAEKVSAKQMDLWVKDLDNWDVCDGSCCHLFVFAKPAWEKAFAWTRRKQEFEKRAGFALGAFLAVHDREARDVVFVRFLRLIEREAWDERNFVRKAVNWALRNIGKRNIRLNRAAILSAERIHKQSSRAARWIAGDALRELQGEAVQRRLRHGAA